MGLFGAIFRGDRNKTDYEQIDGMWLNEEHDSHWVEVANFSEGQPLELSQESCYKNGAVTFVIFRYFDEANNIARYMGCLIPPEQDDFILMVVDRHELSDGSVVKADDWTENRVLHASQYPTIVNAIASARAMATDIKNSTPPPFVMWLSMKVG